MDPQKNALWWNDKVVELYHDQRDTVADVANKWLALPAALAGVFGAIVFVGGVTAIDDLPDPWNSVVKWIMIATAVLALIGFAFLTIAGGDLRTRVRSPSFAGQELETTWTNQAGFRNRLLWIGQGFSIVTLLLFVVGAGFAIGIPKSDSQPKYLATFADRPPAYGEAVEKADGTLSINGQELDKNLTSLTPVETRKP